MKIKIDGKEIKYVYSFCIEQSFNQHHTFECWFYADVIEKGGIFTIDKSKRWIGTSIDIDMGPGKLQFRGIICDVSLLLKDKEMIVVSGYSPTILLETYDGHYESHTKVTLNQVLEKVKIKITGNHLQWHINPLYKKQIDYITQYKESYFAFLNRLSAMYGEFFFYDGKQLCFGKPNSIKNIEMYDQEDITELRFGMHTLPISFSQYNYNYLAPEHLSADAPDISPSDNLAKFAYKKSKSLFTAISNSHAETEVTDRNQFKLLQEKKVKTIASRLIDIKGKGKNPSLSIGCHVKILKRQGESKSDVGKFLITKIKHELIAPGTYSNSFTGVLASTEVLDVENITYPIAEPQIGKVIDSSDSAELGRVRVRMLWQDNDSSTDWIRILTPYAGAQDRGILFIPLPGDEVVVGFHHGDPDRPFVVGSVYNANRNPAIDTNMQTITTAQNSMLYFFNNGEASFLGLTDKNDNQVHIDTSSDTIRVSSRSIIEIQSETVNIKGDVVAIQAQKRLTISGGQLNMFVNGNYSINVDENYQLIAKQITEISEGDFVCSADNDIEHWAGQNANYNANGDVSIRANGSVRFKGESIVNKA
jgi:type VI secretion system secreted protein VgrG